MFQDVEVIDSKPWGRQVEPLERSRDNRTASDAGGHRSALAVGDGEGPDDRRRWR